MARRVLLAPMFGDVAAGAEPNAVATARIVQEFDQAGRLAGPADQPVVQRDAHQLRALGALVIEQVEAVDQILRKFIGGAEAGIAVETVVVGLERIGNDEMSAAADLDPEGQLVAEIVAIVRKAAMLDQKSARVDAWPAVEPSDRRRAGQLLDSGDGELDMLPLLVFRRLMIVEPAPAVADDFVARLGKGAGQFGIHLQAANHAQHADLHTKALEDAQQPPAADPRPIFENRFNKKAAPAAIGREADIGEKVFGMGVALQNRMLAAGLDIEVEIDRDPRAARPARMRRVGAIAKKVSRRAARRQ